MKIDYEKVKSMVVSTIADNREIIGAVVGTALTAKLCKVFNIPITTGFGFRNSFSNKPLIDTSSLKITIGTPATAIQSAIYSIYKNAIGMSSEYYKHGECERIVKILENAGEKADDATKSYAIEAISAIQETMSSSFYKGECTDCINDILEL